MSTHEEAPKSEASSSPPGCALTPEEAALLSVHGGNYQDPLPAREHLYRALTRRGLLQAQTERSVLCRYKSYRLTDTGAAALAAHNA